jgi:hypothetical protein
MGKKLVWFETYETVCKYSVELTDEEATLFEEVDYQSDASLEWEEVKDPNLDDFEIEED